MQDTNELILHSSQKLGGKYLEDTAFISSMTGIENPFSLNG
jgi:hypothetical protein